MNIMEYLQSMGEPERFNMQPPQQAQQQAAPVMPEMPPEDPWRQWIGDPSGFAGAGMNAAPPPDPMVQMGNLMNLAMQQAPPQQQQQVSPMGGNLMNYLRMLSGGQGG